MRKRPGRKQAVQHKPICIRSMPWRHHIGIIAASAKETGSPSLCNPPNFPSSAIPLHASVVASEAIKMAACSKLIGWRECPQPAPATGRNQRGPNDTCALQGKPAVAHHEASTLHRVGAESSHDRLRISPPSPFRDSPNTAFPRVTSDTS